MSLKQIMNSKTLKSSSLSELTLIMILMELTHLGSVASIQCIKNIIIFHFVITCSICQNVENYDENIIEFLKVILIFQNYLR